MPYCHCNDRVFPLQSWHPFCSLPCIVLEYIRHFFFCLLCPPRFGRIMDHFKMALDCFFVVWFIVGTVWIFGGHATAAEAPNLYRYLHCFLEEVQVIFRRTDANFFCGFFQVMHSISYI